MQKKLFVRFKLVLALVLLCVATRANGATVNANPGDNLQADLNSAAGGVLNLAPGTYNVNAPLRVHSGTTINGAVNFGAHLIFNLPATDSTYYGLVLDANAGNVTVQSIDFVSNHGVIGWYNGNGYSNITISNNNFQYGGGQSTGGTLVVGIYGAIAVNGLQIRHNYFHDSPNSSRNWEIWSFSNANISNNLFYNINDGGHLMNAGSNNVFSYNYGTLLARMGQEIQEGIAGASGFSFDHNVFYDWVNPWYNSFGLSVCPTVNNVSVTNNYIRTSFAPGSSWGQPDGSGTNRFGYLIECMSPNLTASGNTLVVAQKSFAGLGAGETTLASGNSAWGGSNALNGILGGDVGPGGVVGSYVLGSVPNVINASLAGAPSPPANTFAGPQFLGGGAPFTPTGVAGATNGNASNTSNGPNASDGSSSSNGSSSNGSNPSNSSNASNASNAPNLSTVLNTAYSANTLPGIPGIMASPSENAVVLSFPLLANISIHTYTPLYDCGTIQLVGSTTTATLTNLNPGWGYTFAITATLNGTTAASTITTLTTGSSPDGTSASKALLGP